ncbi:MAG: heme ABC transporter ATP-binding protein [Armatimonadetes bacterium]|nr:heme ABC transporter ATP-binding protein [Armatimonadota bacterium]
MPALFDLDQVDVSFNSTRVLSGISLQVRAGEFLGIIGPNGSGKSTLLRVMAGVLAPSAGTIKLEGRDVAGIPGRELARRLAVVPQDNPITFDFSVLEVVLMGRSPHLGRFEIERGRDLDIAADALKRTNLLNLADRRIGELSGGERQRAMIARALAQEPEILFLDEPTAHLDINYQVEILHLAKRENTEHGKTVVAILHDLNLAAEFCDRLIMLSHGEVFTSGSPDEVITAENVHEVYGTAVWVRRHPTSGRPYVLSLGSRAIASRLAETQDPSTPRFKVHVICGGGSGGSVFVRLLEMGCEVTAGVINIGDTDQEAAESLGIEYVEDAPFSPISETAERANVEFIRDADAVMVADMPFGAGNLANLRCAASALDMRKPVAVIGKPEAYADRDFAEGEVARMLDDLVRRGASAIESVDSAPDWVAKTRGP